LALNPTIQRVLNDLLKTRIFSWSYDSASRKPSSPQLSRQYARPATHTVERLRKREKQLDDGGEVGKGVGEEPNHTTARKAGPLII
jgi:hypothetical protein